MKYGNEFFDTYIERRGTRSVKWDGCNARFGVEPDVEMLPMWIADMDFKAPDEVVEAIPDPERDNQFEAALEEMKKMINNK